jgi:hypothetical protein
MERVRTQPEETLDGLAPCRRARCTRRRPYLRPEVRERTLTAVVKGGPLGSMEGVRNRPT